MSSRDIEVTLQAIADRAVLDADRLGCIGSELGFIDGVLNEHIVGCPDSARHCICPEQYWLAKLVRAIYEAGRTDERSLR